MNQNQTITGSLTRPPSDTLKLGQVDICLNNARQVVEENEMHFNALESRIIGITNPIEIPLNANSKESPQEMLVPIADIIRNLTQRLEATNNRLRSLLGRIEL